MAQKESRRNVLKYAGTAVAGLVVGGAAGWLAKPTPTMPTPSNATMVTSATSVAKFGQAPPAGTPVSIVHGFDAAYPPFTQVNAQGVAVGFDVDVLQLIAKANGWTIIEKPWQWASIIPALQAGNLDLIMSGLTMLASRYDVIEFSLPYYPVFHELVVLSTETRTLDTILHSGETISVETGSAADDWATKLLAAGFTFNKLGLDTYELALEAVGDKRATGSITDSSFLDPLFRANPKMAAGFRIAGNIGGLTAYGIGTRKADTWLQSQLNHALEDIAGTPQWDDLLAKWNL